MHSNLSRFRVVLLILLGAGCLSAQQVEPQRRLGASQASIVDGNKKCPITKAPDPPFVPPPPFNGLTAGSGEFLYGTSAPWAVVERHWQVQGFAGGKLPYFPQGYDWLKEPAPRLTVVARRLDSPEQMVWAAPASHAHDKDGSFMVTGFTLTAGCWEIAAHYTPASQDKIQTLTYTVWVEP
jgi:hypothetical protein